MNFSDNFSINKKNNSWQKFFIGVVALLFFVAVLNFFNSPIRNAFYVLSFPLQKTFWSAGQASSGFLASFLNVGNLNKKNQDLKLENQKLQTEVAFLQSIVNGNHAQSEVSSACQNNGFDLLMAGVTGLDDYDMLSINKGSVDGVAENMPVISQQGALFGKVFKVYKNYSQVMLISNKNSVVNVKVQRYYLDSNEEQAEIDGIIKGQGNLAIYMDLIPIDDIISQGDVLVTSALEGTFPKDILVGTITKVEKNDQNPHQSAQVQPFLGATTDNLFVITNYKR
jgi:rod shape-determining protein MreC